MKKFFWTIAAILLSSLNGWAEVVADSANTAANPPAMNMGWLLFKTIAILGIIIILIFAGVYFLKRFVFGANAKAGDTHWIKVLGQIQLHPRQTLSLIQVMDRVILVGITESSMQTLTEFENPEEIRPYLEGLQNQGSQWAAGRFKGIFKKHLES
ncbi:MAG: hypothetical protein Kow0037_19820 [Calditrichia bacterium]